MLAKDVHANFQRERLSLHFVYESYDSESGLFFNRGSVGFVLIANPLPGADITAESEIADFIANEENLPNGSSIQILMIGSSDVNYLLDRWKNVRRGEIYVEMAKRRCEFLNNKAKQEGVVRDSHILISVTVPDLQTDLLSMEQRRDALKATLQTIGVWAHDVDDKILLSILRKLWGREHHSDAEINPYASLSEQILPGDFTIYEDKDIAYLKDGECFIALDSEERPRSWSLGLMDLFLGNEARKREFIETDYLLHVGIQIHKKQTSAKARIFAKREAVGKNIKSGLGKWFPDLVEEDIDLSGAAKALQNDERVVHIHTNIILKGKRDKTKLAAKNYSGMMRRNGWHFVRTRYDHLTTMLAVMPMSLVEVGNQKFGNKIIGVGHALAALGRGKCTVSGESKALMPIIGEYKGDLNAPGMLLTGRRGQLKYFSQFGSGLVPGFANGQGSDLENYNGCVAGISGSGKSVALLDMMLSVLSVGGKVFVLDYGKSFKNLCEFLGGNHIEFDPGHPISINPFSEIPTGNDEISSEVRTDFLASFPITLATMAAPKHGTNDLQQTNLSKALRECWEQKQQEMQIDDIASWLLAQNNNPVANDLGRMLFNYTREGSYGGFFQGKAEISLNADIVVIETDHLRNFPDLMAVVVQTMTTHINNVMAKGDTNVPKLLLFDEITKTLENPYAMKNVNGWTRITRKYNASIFTATQFLTDYEKLGADAASIFEGASFKLIMKQNTDTLTKMRSSALLKGYVDSDERFKRLQSVESKKGDYSEFTLWSPGVNGDICRLRIDPFTLLLMSTNPQDKHQIAQKRANGMSLAESINSVLTDRGVG